MSTPQATQSAKEQKEQKEAIKATLKAIEQDYKNKVKEAEKKCSALRKEAEKVAELEKAVVKAKKDKADKEAKDELQQVKHEAGEINIRLVMDLVKNVILDIKSRYLEQEGHIFGSSLHRANTVGSTSSNSGTGSSAAKEDAEIKEWVEYAADRLEGHMSKAQARQRLLEEIASGALIRQHQAQQEALRKTEELQRQIAELQFMHQQQSQSIEPHSYGQVITAFDVAPPSYVNAIGPAGVNGDDYSVLKEKK
ncbi:hypothetical protein BGZ76_002030 [Entomortierella beljakovae]|nr:hypothetical protein BGZ76_002030 [Entomortierella beljakovae]